MRNTEKNGLRGALALLACVSTLAPGGCGGGSSSTSPAGGATTYTVGGTLSGLAAGASVTLVDNGTAALTLTADGSFSFSTSLGANALYDVTVQSQPAGQTCAVSNASGETSSSNVTNVAVSCVSATDTVLYSFDFSGTPDGNRPEASLVMDGAGNLYGTTYFGGAHDVEFEGDGTVFKVSPDGTENVLYSFAGGVADGSDPVGGLIMDSSGNLYGTATGGGANGVGAVFKLSAGGTETLLHAFAGGTSDGANPASGLIMDGAGELYGTTSGGGAHGDGTVFEIGAGGQETVLHAFAGGTDGADPVAGLIMDSAGNLYGTTEQGGPSGNGTVFKISASGAESILYAFGAGIDGRYPRSVLVRDSAGNLYGTTRDGGTFGYGTVFKLSPAGVESIVYSFTGGTADGANPMAGLVMDGAGNLYGTTEQAGAYGYGTVFKVSSAGTESDVHAFGKGTDGQNPDAALIMDSAGNLYGTTALGGTDGSGTVFEVSAATAAAAGSTAGGGTTFVVGGTVSGLTSGQGVTLMNDGTDLQTVSADGGFDFPTRLAPGSAYDVTIVQETPGVSCSLSHGRGTVGTSNVTSITVSCAPPLYPVGGTVSGLSPGESVTLVNNGGDALTLGANGSFSFSQSMAAGSAYDVAVQSHTAGITCPIVNGSGTVESPGVSDISVYCSPAAIILHSFAGATTDGADPAGRLTLDGAGNLYGTTPGGGAHGDGTVFEISASGTESVLYSFAGGTADGANPSGSLAMDSAGNLYGVTENGGAYGDGAVFELSVGGTETLLHSFDPAAADGAYPAAGLLMDSAGNLYGTTQDGGAYGDGTVFEVSAGGTESVLHSFATPTDGMYPAAGLIMDGAGNLYGTTSGGGAHGDGTVFEVSAGGTESILYSFAGGATDGQAPFGALLRDSAGNLYGTTQQGGADGVGTVFELSASGTESLLHSFGAGLDGAYPHGVLVTDSAGNLYGTTAQGGIHGNGAVFKVSVTGAQSLLYSFAGGTSDGATPAAALVMNSAGILYGTTEYGGTDGDGTVFELK